MREMGRLRRRGEEERGGRVAVGGWSRKVGVEEAAGTKLSGLKHDLHVLSTPCLPMKYMSTSYVEVRGRLVENS
jgi:hypothetical protein